MWVRTVDHDMHTMLGVYESLMQLLQTEQGGEQEAVIIVAHHSRYEDGELVGRLHGVYPDALVAQALCKTLLRAVMTNQLETSGRVEVAQQSAVLAAAAAAVAEAVVAAAAPDDDHCH